MRKAKKTKKEIEELVIDEFKILRAFEFDDGNTAFDMEINGIKIYGCTVMSGKNGRFISFPQRKGSDRKYYNVVWFGLSEKDSDSIIDAVDAETK